MAYLQIFDKISLNNFKPQAQSICAQLIKWHSLRQMLNLSMGFNNLDTLSKLSLVLKDPKSSYDECLDVTHSQHVVCYSLTFNKHGQKRQSWYVFNAYSASYSTPQLWWENQPLCGLIWCFDFYIPRQFTIHILIVYEKLVRLYFLCNSKTFIGIKLVSFRPQMYNADIHELDQI